MRVKKHPSIILSDTITEAVHYQGKKTRRCAGMKEIYSSQSPLYCWLLKGILESEGIPCEVRNEYLGQIAGGIPVDQTWPKLFIANDADFDRAKRIIEENRPKLADAPTFCPNCDSEEIELEKTGNDVVFDRFRCKKCDCTWNKG